MNGNKQYKIEDWNIATFESLSHLKSDPTKKLIHNRMGRLYWVWADDRLYEQRFARENGPYQVRNIVFLRDLYPNAERCIDIGMNVANNSMEYATWVKEVHGFEPFPSTYELAEENIKLNRQVPLKGRYWNSKELKTEHTTDRDDGWYKQNGSFASLDITGTIQTYNVGLGSQSGAFKMLEKPNNAGHNHVLAEGMKNDRYKEHDVEIKTLDSYQFETIDFIKIDVEGYEWEVVQGAEQTIDRCRPTVQMEIVEAQCKKFGYTPQTVYDFFVQKNYEMFDFNGNNLGTTWQKLKGVMETFFVPQEISQSVKQKSKTHPGMITGFGKRKKVEKFDDLFTESDS